MIVFTSRCTFHLITISSKSKIPLPFHLNAISSKTNSSNFTYFKNRKVIRSTSNFIHYSFYISTGCGQYTAITAGFSIDLDWGYLPVYPLEVALLSEKIAIGNHSKALFCLVRLVCMFRLSASGQTCQSNPTKESQSTGWSPVKGHCTEIKHMVFYFQLFHFATLL